MLLVLTIVTLLILSACDGGIVPVDTTVTTEFNDGYFGVLSNKKLYITSLGQSSDAANLVKMSTRAGIVCSYDNMLSASDVESGSVVFLVVGCSAKSMAEMDVDVDSELARARQFAEKSGVTLITWHIGGNSRRGLLSDRLIEYSVSVSDYVIFASEGNTDYAISNWAKEYEVAHCQLSSASESSVMLKFLAGERQ